MKHLFTGQDTRGMSNSFVWVYYYLLAGIGLLVFAFLFLL